MSIFEYDQEKHMRQEREQAWEEGREAGMEDKLLEQIRKKLKKRKNHSRDCGRSRGRGNGDQGNCGKAIDAVYKGTAEGQQGENNGKISKIWFLYCHSVKV